MLTNLDRHYNARFKYPVIIYHDDFTEADKHTLQVRFPLNPLPSMPQAPSLTRPACLLSQSTVFSKLEFRDIAFEIPAWLDKARIPERTPCSPHSSTVGYRHMNR